MNKMERSLSTRECKPISIEAPRLSRWAGTSILQRRHHRLQRYKMEKSCVPTEKRKEAYKCKVTPLLKNKNVAWRHLPYRATGTERRTYAILCVHARVPHRHLAGQLCPLGDGRVTTQKDRDTSRSKRAGEKGSGCGDDTRTEKAGGCRRTPRVRAKKNHGISQKTARAAPCGKTPSRWKDRTKNGCASG